MIRSWWATVGTALLVSACGGATPTVADPIPVTALPTVSATTVPPTTQPITTTSTTTSTTTVPIEVLSTPGDRSCPGWLPLARQVGWPEDQLDKLSYIMWRESRCDPLAHNKTDPASGSRGLTQINGYWCRPSQYSARGWLQDREVLAICDDLYDPETNLRAALHVWYYGKEKGRSGWGPWAV